MKKLKMIAHILEPIVKEVLRAKKWSFARAAGIIALTGAVFAVLKKVFHSFRKAGAIMGCLMLIAALAACSSPAKQAPTLTLAKSSYTADVQEIVVRLSNPSDKEISCNAAYWVESYDAAGTHGTAAHGHKIDWKTAPAVETLVLAAGENKDITVRLSDLSKALTAGTYRVGMDVDDTPLYVNFTIV